MNPTIGHCRACGSENLETVHDFGVVPLADKLTDRPGERVPSANLSLAWCAACGHLQIRENVDPQILFNDHYPYYSSKIPEVVRHFESTYQTILETCPIGPGDLVLELAANDGVLLRHFGKHTDRLVSVEPSEDHAALTRAMGIDTWPVFFDRGVADQMREKYGRSFRLILANNVLAHVPAPIELALGIAGLLADNGVAVIEVPASMNMIRNATFDVVFHQHFSYFSLHSLTALFSRAGLHINRVDRIDTQGGGYRLYIGRVKETGPEVQAILEAEKKAGLTEPATYREFSRRIEELKTTLVAALTGLKNEGNRLMGYGAPGKAATLLNYFGIDHTLLECLIDISDSKHYKYFPDTGLQILPLSHLEENTPDYLLILAWNYAGSIVKSLAHLHARGMRFIHMYPEVTVE